MAEAVPAPTQRAAGDLSGLVDRRELLHLDRPRRRPARLESAGRCPGRARRRGPARSIRTRVAQAREEVLIAEGSDWFWWYGDDHSSDARPRVRRPVPPAPAERLPAAAASRCPTSCSSATSRPARRAAAQTEPTALLTPTLDGEETSYFEWLGAGTLEVREVAGAMHQTDRRPAVLTLVQFGFDRERLFVRLDAGGRSSTCSPTATSSR